MQKKNSYVKLPYVVLADLSLKPVEVRVYAAIRSYRNEKTKGRAFPSRQTIASLIGCSKATVARSIRSLKQKDYIEWQKGGSKFANTYSFRETSHEYVGAKAAQLGINDAPTVGARMIPQSDTYNHKHKPEKTLRLFHGKDLASVMEDGLIRIKSYSNSWVDWSGGDVEAFRFDELFGDEARKAALKHFLGGDWLKSSVV